MAAQEPQKNPSAMIAEMQFARKTHNPRMTTNVTVIHQLPGEDAQSFGFTGLQEEFQSEEKPYDRTITVGETPVVLEFGWLGGFENVKYIMLHNINSVGRVRNPTDEEKEAARAAVICVIEPNILIGSGSVVPPINIDSPKLTVRCLKGETRLRYIGIPK